MKLSLSLLIITLTALILATSASAKTQYYVALGDSYASGYQPGKGNSKEGFVYQVPALAQKSGYKLKVVNFGCAGATTRSLVSQKGCPKQALGPGAKSYKQTQLAAATKFIKANRNKIALITVSISGNDVTSCAKAAEPIPCVAAAQTNIKTNVTRVARELRKAAGKKPLLVGTTYPDVVLGAWVNPGGEAGQSLAKLSVVAFESLINPALKEAYASGQGRFVDVTAATGAYDDLADMTKIIPYGMVPRPVATICRISWYCDQRDIHLNKEGYKIIAEMVAAQLPKR